MWSLDYVGSWIGGLIGGLLAVSVIWFPVRIAVTMLAPELAKKRWKLGR